MVSKISNDTALANECMELATEVKQALQQYAVTTHPQFGKVYAYEVNGFGSFNLMDDANIPSLLSPALPGCFTPNRCCIPEYEEADPVFL